MKLTALDDKYMSMVKRKSVSITASKINHAGNIYFHQRNCQLPTIIRKLDLQLETGDAANMQKTTEVITMFVLEGISNTLSIIWADSRQCQWTERSPKQCIDSAMND